MCNKSSVASYNVCMTHCIKLYSVTVYYFVYFVNVFTTALTGMSSVLDSSICLLLLDSSQSPNCVELFANALYRVTSQDTPWTLL